jgi:hypothetical protein
LSPNASSSVGAADQLFNGAVAGGEILSLSKDWLRPTLDSGELEAVLRD